jgi:hypothetical protein
MNPQEVPINDKYVEYISLEQRQVLLSSPTPLMVEVLAGALREQAFDSSRKEILARVLRFATTGKTIPPIVSHFIEQVENGPEEFILSPYTDGSNSAYLAIAVGTAIGVRDKSLGSVFTAAVDGVKDPMLKATPDKGKLDEALKAITTIAESPPQK